MSNIQETEPDQETDLAKLGTPTPVLIDGLPMWCLRTRRELSDAEKDRLRLVLYYLDNLTVEDKEALVAGSVETWVGSEREICDLQARFKEVHVPIVVQFRRSLAVEPPYQQERGSYGRY
jgi:hypothetical protein